MSIFTGISHHVDGVSHAVRRKGFCHAGVYNFLVAVPVKTFDSGDSNRDEHMQMKSASVQGEMKAEVR